MLVVIININKIEYNNRYWNNMNISTEKIKKYSKKL